ncbi:MAG: site-2 protease family protein [Clostridia bacterium]|nr:site-2 protease family protein [Clostridia bacterium]
MLYVLIAILLFGILIFIHELGHYIFARIFHVTINEFSIGMGPKLISIKSKKTGIAYSVRLLPIGGFVSMVGEDEESDDPNALNRKPVWQRIIITAAGSLSNILLGVIVVFVTVVSSKYLLTTTVADFRENAVSVNYGLQAGDTIVSVGPRNIHIADDLSIAISRYADKPIDVAIIRDGKKTVLKNVVFPTQENQGVVFGTPDFYVYSTDKTFGGVIKNTFYSSVAKIRLIYDSLYDLISGKYGFTALSGPVGVTETLANAAKEKDYSYLAYLFEVIAMNLGVMNLLPIPALDGGRLLFMLIELITKKRVPPKAEGIVHFIGIIILLAFMFAVTCKDIIFLIRK